MPSNRGLFSLGWMNRTFTGFSQDFKCCWVLRIKTGAIIVALVFMGFQAILFCAVSTLVIKNLNVNQSEEGIGSHDLQQNTLLHDHTDGVIRTPHDHTLAWQRGSFDADDAFISLITMGICVLLTAVLIFGVLTNQARLLTPFLCMQMFDFVFSAFATTGTWTNMANFRKILLTHIFPYRDQLISMNINLLTFLIVIVSVIFLVVKIYMMCVVWTCYHFISRNPILPPSLRTNNNATRQHQSSTADRHLAASDVFTPPPSWQQPRQDSPGRDVRIDLAVLPPKYEEVVLLPPNDPNETPPPPYTPR